jgi:integrase
MVELQRLTGMRPGEACRLRLAEVDRTGDVWAYRPARHKTAHHGKARAIHLGPRAQSLIAAFLRGGSPPLAGFLGIDLTDETARLVAADAYQEAGRERDAGLLRDLARPVVLVAGCVVDPAATLFSPARAREDRFRAARLARKSKVPPSQQNRRKADPKLTPAAEYTLHTYTHAVRKAAEKAGVPHWHPNQLRHLFATEVRRGGHGLEAVQVLLGHARADVTQIYAERNEALAAAVAAKIG